MKGVDANILVLPGLYGGHLTFKVDEGHFYRDNKCADSNFCWLFCPAKETFNCQAKLGKLHNHQVPSEETVNLSTVLWALKLRVIRQNSKETIAKSVESVVSTWPRKLAVSISGILTMFAPTLQQFQIMAEDNDPYVRYFTKHYGEDNLTRFCRAILQLHPYWTQHGEQSPNVPPSSISTSRKEGKQNTLMEDNSVLLRKISDNAKGSLSRRTNCSPISHCYSLRKCKNPVIRYQNYPENRKYQVAKQWTTKNSGLTQSMKSNRKCNRQFLLRPPTDFQVESVTENTAKVTWLSSPDVPKNSIYLNRVRYWINNENVSFAIVMKINARQNECYLQLDPEKTYYVDITVITKAGRQISPIGTMLSLNTPARKIYLDKEDFMRNFSLIRKE